MRRHRVAAYRWHASRRDRVHRWLRKLGVPWDRPPEFTARGARLEAGFDHIEVRRASPFQPAKQPPPRPRSAPPTQRHSSGALLSAAATVGRGLRSTVLLVVLSAAVLLIAVGPSGEAAGDRNLLAEAKGSPAAPAIGARSLSLRQRLQSRDLAVIAAMARVGVVSTQATVPDPSGSETASAEPGASPAVASRGPADALPVVSVPLPAARPARRATALATGEVQPRSAPSNRTNAAAGAGGPAPRMARSAAGVPTRLPSSVTAAQPSPAAPAQLGTGPATAFRAETTSARLPQTLSVQR